jgi:hypothetical protein
MHDFWKRSRITKALTDAARAASFAEAEARLDTIRIAVVVGADEIKTRAGQAAVLTSVATASKCFGRVTLVIAGDATLLTPLPLGDTLRRAARVLGARLSERVPRQTTHAIRIGDVPSVPGWNIRCWWDRWLGGTRAADDAKLGDSSLAFSGVFAAAVAIRQIFACVLVGRTQYPRDVTVNLWEPWRAADLGATGPVKFDVPDKLWFLGLGHLGQGFVWNLCLLGVRGGRAVAQDNQTVGDENEATSLLVLYRDLGAKKARVAARWLEACGWETDIIERRYNGDIRVMEDDPPYLLCGLDRLGPRLIIARHGFEFMIDAGLGHGPNDFEGIQIRTVAKGQSIEGLWNEAGEAENDSHSAKLMEKKAYAELESRIGRCGIVNFAEASTAVPFVGAAAGALVIAQVIRLASLQPATRFLHMELGTPEMVGQAGLTAGPAINLGSISINVEELRMSNREQT